MTTRRNAIQWAVAAPLVLVGGKSFSNAPEFRWKWANSQPTNHPDNVRAREAIQRIREQSGGRLQIDLYPDGQLGSDSDMNAQVRSGAIDMYATSGGLLGAMVPVAGIVNMPFAFTDYSEVWKAMDGELGAHVNNAVQKRTGLHLQSSYFDLGFRVVTSNTRPIGKASDFHGFKIRVPNSRIAFSLFKSLGAAPVSMNVAEVYTALQTGVVDGQENPLLMIDTHKFNEVQKYCSITHHSWEAFIIVTNGRRWAQLPADLQEIVSRNLRQSALDQRKDSEEANKRLRASLEKRGLVFNDPDVNGIREGLLKSGFYKEWRSTMGEEAWSILGKYSPALA